MEYVIECDPLDWPKYFEQLKKEHFKKDEYIVTITHQNSYHYISTNFYIDNEPDFNGG